MKYLLDTDVIISHIHKKTPISINLNNPTSISVITFGEILYGIEKMNNNDRRKEFYNIISELQLRIIPVTELIIKRYVTLKITLERKGQKLDEFDLLIGATALEHDLTLVSANRRHFLRIPHLKLA